MAAKDLVKITKDYYNSQDADQFYFQIWGGEDIHVGIYDPKSLTIREASRLTVAKMADLIAPINKQTKILDIGAGYGGAARYLVKSFDCQVTCLNLSEKENQRHITQNEEQGISQSIEVITGNFEALPFEDRSFDVVWCQDAILHSGQKEKVFEEVYRVLKAQGQFIFTDPMQSDDCPEGVLKEVLARIHLEGMGAVERYESICVQLGFEKAGIYEMPKQLVHHYTKVLQALELNYNQLKEVVTTTYLDHMSKGLKHWIKAGQSGYLNWGIMHFNK